MSVFICLYRNSFVSSSSESTAFPKSQPSETSQADNIIDFNQLAQQVTPASTATTQQRSADILLNLSLEETKGDEEELFAPKLTPDMDLLASDFGSKMTTDDLLGLGANSASAADANLLSTPVEDHFFDSPTEPLAPTQAANKLNANNNNLLRNTSTPNLANFDPFGDFNSFLNFSNSEAGKAGASIPRVSSYNTFNDKNASNANAAPNSTTANSKPNYSRSIFGDIPSTTGVKTPRMVGNEFEDLLGGFKKTTPVDSNPKSIAQLRKEELVCGLLV